MKYIHRKSVKSTKGLKIKKEQSNQLEEDTSYSSKESLHLMDEVCINIMIQY